MKPWMKSERWSHIAPESCIATMWRAGYGLAGPGLVSIDRLHEMVRPSRTDAAAFRRTSGVMKLSVPSSSSSPHRPQFEYCVRQPAYSSAVGGVRSLIPMRRT